MSASPPLKGATMAMHTTVGFCMSALDAWGVGVVLYLVRPGRAVVVGTRPRRMAARVAFDRSNQLYLRFVATNQEMPALSVSWRRVCESWQQCHNYSAANQANSTR